MHQLMDVKVHEWGVEGQAMLHRAAIESWTTDKWGQPSVQIAEWLIEDDIVQAFIRLQQVPSSLMQQLTIRGICAAKITSTFHSINGTLVPFKPIELETRVRFRHRHAEIILCCEIPAPEWGQALLEEWLMAQRGEETRPKVPNSDWQPFDVRKQALSDIWNNQISIMQRNCSP